MNISSSQSLFEKAGRVIPGGVNSPVRAFRSVGGQPRFMARAQGAYLFDADGNRYIDFIASWGPMILGHAFPPVVDAIRERVGGGTSFGTPTATEVVMAELIVGMVPGIDMVRMVSSGTEACMSAIRLARGFTGRNKFIKFEGNYHGHADPFLVHAGSGLATLGIQSVPGVTASVAADTLSCAYNDLAAVEALAAEYRGQLAAIILEPVAGNMGCIPPAPGFLAGLRALCDREHILLIFDEVMTGFRLAPGGAQEWFGVRADILTFGKVIGGGMPVGAFAARREIMQQVAPLGKVYQAGTLSGNPIAMIAGLTTLSHLKEHPEVFASLEKKTARLKEGLAGALRPKGFPFSINQLGSMLSVHFGAHPVTDFASSAATDQARFGRFFHHLLDRGIYLPPSPFESWFLNDALSDADLEETVAAAVSFAG